MHVIIMKSCKYNVVISVIMYVYTIICEIVIKDFYNHKHNYSHTCVISPNPVYNTCTCTKHVQYMYSVHVFGNYWMHLLLPKRVYSNSIHVFTCVHTSILSLNLNGGPSKKQVE